MTMQESNSEECLSLDCSAPKNSSYVVRKPISIFYHLNEAKDKEERDKSDKVLNKLRESLPIGFKIGAAVSGGDCFFDSLVQGLMELEIIKLKYYNKVNIKRLRQLCKLYAMETSPSPRFKQTLGKEEKEIEEYIKNVGFTEEDANSIKSKNIICGRPHIEGKIISKKFGVKIKITKVSSRQSGKLNFREDTIGKGDKIIYLLEYHGHFVPLLSNIGQDIQENIIVCKKDVYDSAITLNERHSLNKKTSKITRSIEESLLKRKQDQQKVKQKKEQAFDEILDYCERIIFNKINKGENIFELLDPLVSDTQCQIHCLLILDILYKFYDGNNYKYDIKRFEKLKVEERKTFLCAVLLSLFKFKQKDKFGFNLIEISLVNFTSKCPVKSGKKLIAKAKQYFNSRSVIFIKYHASEKIKQIFDDCQAIASHSRVVLKLLPCYASFYAAFQCIKNKKLPIIISLIRINIKKISESTQYNMVNNGVYFYEFQESKDGFCHKKNLSESETRQPAYVVTCFSIIGEHNSDFTSEFRDYIEDTKLPSDQFLTSACDIVNLMMTFGAGHVQISEKAVNTEDVKTLYEKHSNNLIKLDYTLDSKCKLEGTEVHNEYIAHLALAHKCNMVNAKYSKLSDNNLIHKRAVETFFSAKHIYPSNYLLEYQRMQSLDVNIKLDETEPLKEIDRAQLTLDVLIRDLGIGVNSISK